MQWYNRKKQTKKQKFDEEMKATDGLGILNPTRRGFMSTAGSVAIGAMGVAGANTLVALNNGAKADGEPIPVGGMLPYTGWGADDARNFEIGLTMAAEEINELGGVLGRPIEFHFEDTKSITAETVTSAARRLIDRHNVHAIINGYNSPSVRAEYDTVADAGVPYIHDNTQYGHQFAVRDNPDRYYCIFQDDPSEYYYGPGLIYFLDELERTGKWKRPNNKIALFSGSIDYAVTIAGGIRDTYKRFGWELAIDDVVTQPVDDWGPSLVRVRDIDPAIVVTTHGVPSDQTGMVTSFAENPTNSLLYVQYALQLRAFLDIVKETGHGVFCSTTIGTLNDEIGAAFRKLVREKHGQDATPMVAGQVYDSVYLWAIAAARAGGTGVPYDGIEQNRKVCDFIRSSIYRGVVGTIRFMWGQAATPYPAETNDPSLGMPTIIMQCQDYTKDVTIIGPDPYAEGDWMTPPWLK
ncbi:MAG: ABC transporter substrate-binding protein [Alphaproteobacteria bacterium]|jgi:branched-chain amino acid transport system substrate-binding protein|nr:ABC transporter substrate-binding protein [Alphaproteobacteria bacterium]